jgi:CubicO group peptidase (beta-lactamase class C family)
MSRKLQNVLDRHVAAQDVPFAVGMIGNAREIVWSGAAGDRKAGVPATVDTVFRIFSMTKAVGSTAAAILIDRGKLDPDMPVEKILPEFKDLQVLEGFDGDTPRLRKPKVKATVRHLSTHTSGLVYEFWNADMQKYLAVTGHPSILAGTKAAMMYPLTFDPGTRWDYGIGIDWLGRCVEAVDGRRIDRFLKDEIFGPLGMVDTACEVEAHMEDRLCACSIRGEDGTFSDFTIAPPSRPEVYGMGHNLYSTAVDYSKFVRMWMNKGKFNGHRLMSAKTASALLANNIGKVRVGPMRTVAPPLTADTDFFPGTSKTHSFAFMRMEADVPKMRHRGSQSWAGVCNTHYWFDPVADVFGLLMTQSLPFVEPRFMSTYIDFEKATYATMAKAQAA